MALTAHKKLQILAEAVKLKEIFLTDAVYGGGDTGLWRGSDTGSATRNSRVHSAKLAAILNANTQYAAEGWYINTKAILVSFGETVT
jgi:hypothetical protein